MIRQTGLAQAIDIAENRAKYDECAKKLLSYKAIIAWILKSCTKEFSQYGVQYICDNCLKEEAEVSTYAVHQDELDKNDKLDGDKRVEGMNTESNSIQEHTIYYDIRLPAFLPKSNEIVRLILNLEIQLDDTPGYPIVKRGFYYCGRMVSDLMEVVVLNLGDADKSSDLEILDLLNVLFSATTTPEEKKQRLNDEFEIAMTVEFESEVQEMCNLSKALVEQGIKQGIKQGIELGKEERTLSMAQMMIQEREPIEKIEKYTGYTLEKLREIATKIGIPLMTE